MKLLVTGAAGFIGSTYVRLVGDEHEVVVLDKLTYAGRRENLPEGDRADRGRDRGPGGRARGDGGLRRGRQLRRRVPRRPLDRRPGRLRPHPRDRHRHAARRRPRARRRAATCRSRPTRSTARSSRAPSPRPRRSTPPRPTRRPRRPATCSSPPTSTPTGSRPRSCRGSNNYGPRQYPEKLIPLMVLNALHGDSLPVYGDGTPGPQLALRRGLLPRHPHGADEGQARRGLQRRRPRRVREHRGGQAGDRADRRRRVADRVRQRPPRPRPPLLALLRQAAARSSAGRPQVHFAEGLERTVDWYRENEEWWGPIRSGEYREYYEKQYGKALG